MPLINIWDETYGVRYHKDFEASRAASELFWKCPLTNPAPVHHENPHVIHGEISADIPWISPPLIPMAGATRTDPHEVKVIAYHGLCCSHSGLTYVAKKAKRLHVKATEWTSLDPKEVSEEKAEGFFRERT